jgi:hypothetical protein
MNMANEKTITMAPIILLIITMALIVKYALILSISHVNPYHHSNAPAAILR